MRIAMLSCNTGEGHNSTARAIQEVLNGRGVECETVDVLALLSPRISRFICNWHARLYKYTPKLWDVGYRAVENMDSRSDESDMLFDILAFGNNKLKTILEQGSFDAAICTHVFAAMMMTELRKSWNPALPCYFVATDYTCYPYANNCDIDGFFIPARDLSGDYISAGIPAEKLIPSGIPVRQEFYRQRDRQLARKQLDLTENAFVALLMCGSMGCGPMRKLAKDLAERMPENSLLVAFCGKNEKLFDSLSSIENPKLRVMGYTNQIATYMDAADVIVTKPGGLSSTEAANKRLPMVFINAVGGCENYNFSFFLNRGYAVGSPDPEKVVSLAAELACDPARRERMTEALGKGFACNSGEMIADIVLAAARKYRGVAEIPEGIEAAEMGNPLDTEGGCSMETKNCETILNLARSFAGESQARTRYTIYAEEARKEGMEWIARIFEETAANEAVHAEEFLEMLKSLGGCADNIDLTAGYPYQLGNTTENLAAAAAGELHEHDEAYPAFAQTARQEGFDDAARLWLQIARIEGVHHNTFLAMKEQLESGTMTKKEKAVVWRCLNCGYTYEGPNACDPCPVCGKSAYWQEGELDKKKMLDEKH